MGFDEAGAQATVPQAAEEKQFCIMQSVHNLKFFVTHQYFKKTLWYRKSILRITEQFNWEEVFEGRTNLRSDLMLMLGVCKPRNTEFLRFNPLVNHQCFGYSINISLTQRHPIYSVGLVQTRAPKLETVSEISFSAFRTSVFLLSWKPVLRQGILNLHQLPITSITDQKH